MKRIIASELITLNGCFSGPDGEVDWFMWDGDTDREVFELMNQTDCLLLGFKTYVLLSEYWSKATLEDPQFIQRINSLPKLVVCNNAQTLDWNADALIAKTEQELVDAVQHEKQKRNLLIFGSGTIVSPLTKHKLINEYRIFLNPVILESGKELFYKLDKKVDLKLSNTKVFDNGVTLLEYNV